MSTWGPFSARPQRRPTRNKRILERRAEVLHETISANPLLEFLYARYAEEEHVILTLECTTEARQMLLDQLLAKRMILQDYAEVLRKPLASEWTKTRHGGLTTAVYHLLTAFTQHPDFDEEWL